MERATLVALYNAAGGDAWMDNANWLSAAPIGEWYGVAADADGQVARLELHDNNLIGTIPPELGRLSRLQELRLDGNSLTGIIPPELGRLSSLQGLSLGDNDLSGGIPPELGELSSLQALA